ncbi:hypothetical protein IFR05_014175 [Cadophora sp. M221]|nr:hypothetical protein IFR05_014175 [Cadophora sp. M221]
MATRYILSYFPQIFITQVRHLAISPSELDYTGIFQPPLLESTGKGRFYGVLKPFSSLETLCLIGPYERPKRAHLLSLSVVTESLGPKTDPHNLYYYAHRAKEAIGHEHRRHPEWNCPEIKVVTVKWAMGVACGIPK